jgi:uncharacterized membrane protein SpoIIM required for sporulation
MRGISRIGFRDKEFSSFDDTPFWKAVYSTLRGQANMRPNLLFAAWKKLVMFYLVSFAGGMAVGQLLLDFVHLTPERLFELSTKRLSYTLPVLETGAKAGIDGGILLFLWNCAAALATVSFIYSASLFNPLKAGQRPRALRKLFCNPVPMKLLCFLPGCLKIETESLRRLYVWLMIPLIGMILLGTETGLSASTAKVIFGSFQTAILSLVPHGIIEIPAFALAGAVPFSAHLRIRSQAADNQIESVFGDVEVHKKALPIKKIVLCAIGGLMIAAMVEAHLTPMLMG